MCNPMNAYAAQKFFCDKCQMLCAVIAENKDEYNMCNEQFGKCVKPEVLVFKEYVDRMREGQNDIYQITCECVAVMSLDFFLVALRKKSPQVLVHVQSYH